MALTPDDSVGQRQHPGPETHLDGVAVGGAAQALREFFGNSFGGCGFNLNPKSFMRASNHGDFAEPRDFKSVSQDKTFYFERFGKALSAGLIGVAMAAVSGGIALVAVSFALYAALETVLSPAASAAATAGVFALICAVFAVVTPRLVTGAPKAPSHNLASSVNPANVTLAIEIAIVLCAGLAEASRRRRETTRVGGR